MEDIFEDHALSLTAPVTHASAIAPNDAAELNQATRAIYVGIGGDLAIEMLDGGALVLTNVQGGVLYPFRIRRVLATGTTAAGLVGVY